MAVTPLVAPNRLEKVVLTGGEPTARMQRFLVDVAEKLAVIDNIADETSITTADATDLTTVITLANDTKATVNSMITKLNTLLADLRTSGRMV